MSQATDIELLVEGSAALDKWSLGRLIRLFEDSRPEGVAARLAAMAAMDERNLARHAAILGFTGTPGAGKSTLLGEIATRLVASRDVSAALIAIDPTSHRSGGSLLGDRTRVRFPLEEKRLFFRSQASELELGGIGRATYQVVRVLERLFDVVFVETVGIGQSEIEVERLVDRLYLVLQPMAGDQVQFMKAGIMEVPHVFVLNKSDNPEARKSFYALRASVDFARPGEDEPPAIIRTSATTGEGLDDLLADITSHLHPAGKQHAARRDIYFFEKWVRDEFGRLGLRKLDEQGSAAGLLTRAGSFERAQQQYLPPA